jgi:hypothetical protein
MSTGIGLPSGARDDDIQGWPSQVSQRMQRLFNRSFSLSMMPKNAIFTASQRRYIYEIKF